MKMSLLLLTGLQTNEVSSDVVHFIPSSSALCSVFWLWLFEAWSCLRQMPSEIYCKSNLLLSSLSSLFPDNLALNRYLPSQNYLADISNYNFDTRDLPPYLSQRRLWLAEGGGTRLLFLPSDGPRDWRTQVLQLIPRVISPKWMGRLSPLSVCRWHQAGGFSGGQEGSAEGSGQVRSKGQGHLYEGQQG